MVKTLGKQLNVGNLPSNDIVAAAIEKVERGLLLTVDVRTIMCMCNHALIMVIRNGDNKKNGKISEYGRCPHNRDPNCCSNEAE